MTAYPEVTVDDLEDALAAGAMLFDVREPDEYTAGHVPGAVLIPLGEVTGRVSEFPVAEAVYLICRTGGRSGQAAAFLREQGIGAINVAGGTMGWITSGRDVVAGGSPS